MILLAFDRPDDDCSEDFLEFYTAATQIVSTLVLVTIQ
jgi:hypothetical protein